MKTILIIFLIIYAVLATFALVFFFSLSVKLDEWNRNLIRKKMENEIKIKELQVEKQDLFYKLRQYQYESRGK